MILIDFLILCAFYGLALMGAGLCAVAIFALCVMYLERNGERVI